MKLKINLLFSVFVTALCNAQIITNVTGVVTGKVGEPIPNATISIDGTSLSAITNTLGSYSLTGITPSTYNITASAIGYESQTLFKVVVKSVGNPEINFTLIESSVTLDEVVIKKSKIKRSRETPLSAQSLSAVEISNYPGGNNDVVRVAQSLPGISPSPGGFRNDLIIRGGAPNETVYYLDGMEIPNINHFSTQGSSGGPVGLLNVSFIEDVTLSSSAFGSQYDNPLSGVLQFKQRKGNPEKFRGNFRISASEAATTLEGPIFKGDKEKSNTTFLASVRRSYLQFLFEVIGLPIRPNYWDYQYKVNHKIDDYNEINFLGVGSIDEFSLESGEDLTPSEQVVFDQSPFIEQNTNAIGLSWKKRFKQNNGFMQTTLSNNFLKNNFTSYADNANQQGILFQNNSEENETKLRYELTYFYGDWKLFGGFNTQLSKYSNQTLDYNGSTYDSTIDFVKYGFFANATRSFFENKLDVSLGFRMDDDTFLDNSDLLDTFSPRFSLSYELQNNWRINGSMGSYFKILPYTVLGYRDENYNLSNKQNRYTQSNHFSLGVDKTIGEAAKFSIEGFYKRYSDYPVSILDGISLANKGADFEVLGNEAIQSTGKGRTYGLEVLFQQKFVTNFFTIASYTFFYSEFTGLTNTYLPSVWDSRHLFSLTTGYKFKRNWEVSLRNRFAGKTPFVPVNEEATVNAYPDIILNYSQLGTQKLAVFNQLDIRVDKKWNFKKLSLNIFAQIENALSQTVPEAPQYGLLRDDSGSVVNPRQLISVDASNSTLIPSIGIVVDF